MDGVDILVAQEIGVVCVPPLDAVSVSELVEFGPRPLAERHEFGVGMPLVDGDKLGVKTQAHYGCADLARRAAHKDLSRLEGITAL